MAKKEPKILKEGDTVLWRDTTAKVKSIELCKEGEKEGVEVEEVCVDGEQHFVVTLDNGHWAYGSQIILMEDVKEFTEERKQELVDEVIKGLKKDMEMGDETILDELLKMIPVKNLLQALPEERWTEFPEVKL